MHFVGVFQLFRGRPESNVDAKGGDGNEDDGNANDKRYCWFQEKSFRFRMTSFIVLRKFTIRVSIDGTIKELWQSALS